MARLLYRLGRFSARRAWQVLAGWILVLALGGVAFVTFGGAISSNFSIPGTPTEQVTDRLRAELPEAAGAAATVVFQADRAFTDDQRRAITDLLADTGRVSGVARVVDPFQTDEMLTAQRGQLADGNAELDFQEAQLDAAAAQLAALPVAPAGAEAELAAARAQLEAGRTALADGERLLDAAEGLRSVSPDGRTALGTIAFDQDFFTLSTDVKEAVSAKLDAAAIDGVTINYSQEITASLDGLLGPGEIIGVLLALVVLLVMLRALLPALLPLVTSVIGVGVGIVLPMTLSGIVEMSSVTPALGVMLGLAVGIDYALFIVNRHRRELSEGVEVREAIATANGTAGSAVVFAGATVTVALVALTVTGVPFLATMGLVAAFAVVIAVLVAVTAVPALLRLIGMRALSRRARSRVRANRTRHQAPPQPMRTWKAILAVVVGAAALATIALPALDIRFGLLDTASEPVESTQYQAYRTVADEFGPGRGSPLLVVADLDTPVADETAMQADIVDFLIAHDDVAAVAPIGVAESGRLMAFQLIPTGGSTSESTEQLVHTLRASDPPAGVADLGVAGSASAAIDISDQLGAALPLYLLVIVLIALVLLIAVFRSLLVPLFATLGFVLSFFAALGAVTAVYQWGWLGSLLGVHDPGPVLSFAPILLVGMLFGLAMDYQIFLVAGMREAFVHGVPARVAVITGLRSGRAVVTAAAIIMASVFGGFVFSHIGAIRPLGFGLAVGVLFDAFIVRMLITPAVIHLLGRSAWWLPKWLDRIVPQVDVEGAALERAKPLGR